MMRIVKGVECVLPFMVDECFMLDDGAAWFMMFQLIFYLFAGVMHEDEK